MEKKIKPLETKEKKLESVLKKGERVPESKKKVEEPLPKKKEEEKSETSMRKEVLKRMANDTLSPRAKHIADIYDGKKVVDSKTAVHQ